MKKITIKQLNKDISTLGLGTMIFAPNKKDLAFEILDTFVENGGNFIDTAEIYGDPEEYGYSETTLGMWLSERKNRQDVVIMSKGCIPGTCKPLHPEGAEISPKGIRAAISGSLERLQTDYLDIWLFHRDDPGQSVGPLVEALNQEIRDGRILSYGGSNWTVSRIVEANEYAARNGLAGMVASSPHFSLAKAKESYWPDTVVTTEDDARWFTDHQFPLFAWSSLGRGFFAKGHPEFTEDENLVRVFYSDDNFQRLARAEELGKKKGLKGIEVALAYVTNQKFPAVALAGPESKEQVLSCLRSADADLTEEELAWLDLKSDRMP